MLLIIYTHIYLDFSQKVKKLKRELSQMKQELLYKEQGFETLQQ